jgi:hypothetical protein
MRLTRSIFHCGLAMAATLLVGTLLATRIEGFGIFVDDRVALVYLAMACVHILALGAASARATDQPAVAASSLYTAGFLHTLIALGVSIALAGALLARTEELTMASLGLILVPMGTAVLPHALGVWMGHSIEAAGIPNEGASDTPRAGLFAPLEQEIAAGRDTLRSLMQDQERLLRESLSLLREQLEEWRATQAAIRDELASSRSAVKQLSATFDGAVKSSEEQIRKLGAAWARLQRAVDRTRAAYATLADGLIEAAAASKPMREELLGAADVVRDIQKVHQSVVDLLEAELFARS